MRLEHGEHNEELCDFLFGKMDGKLNDWVVTTAFYACIHFAEHALFPARIGGRGGADFNAYCKYMHEERGSRTSKHSLKAELVGRMATGTKERYKWLKNTCM